MTCTVCCTTHVLLCVCVCVSENKNERLTHRVADLLASDRLLAKELEFDLRQMEQRAEEAEQQEAIAAQADAKRAVISSPPAEPSSSSSVQSTPQSKSAAVVFATPAKVTRSARLPIPDIESLILCFLLLRTACACDATHSWATCQHRTTVTSIHQSQPSVQHPNCHAISTDTVAGK